MIDVRLRNRIAPEELERKKGKVLREGAYNALLTGPSRVRKTNGELLAIYLPGALREQMDLTYDVLTKIRMATDNRGLASGAPRIKVGTTRTRHVPVYSGVMGAMDPVGPMQYCRLTAFTAKETEKWEALLPLWRAVAAQFEENVPERFANQMKYVRETPPEWVIPDTPFTTITINNSYATGVHTDSGDLDEGFSCLAVARKGNYQGGTLVFPEWRVGVNMQHGDLLLMDAHEYHGNTVMTCECGEMLRRGPCKECGSERISVVCYYRTQMRTCSTFDEEAAKKAKYGERRLDEADEAKADLAAVTTT